MEQEQTHEQPTLLIASAPSRRLTAIDESVAGIRTLEWAATENPACAHICEAAIRVKKSSAVCESSQRICQERAIN